MSTDNPAPDRAVPDPVVSDSDGQGPVRESTSRERIQVRRAPKIWVFLASGAVLGVIAAVALTFAFSGTPTTSTTTGPVQEYGLTQVFGFLLVCSIPIGVALMAVVAILLERILSRRAVEVDVDRIDVVTGPEPEREATGQSVLPQGTETPSATEDQERS